MNSVRTDTKTGSLDAHKKQPAETGIVFNILTSPIFWLTVGFILSAAAATGKPMQNDEASWVYMARLWVDYGQPPYIGTVDNKTPGVHYLYYISYSLFGPILWFSRLVGAAVIAISGLGIYLLLKKLGFKVPAVFASILFYLIMPTNLVGGESTSVTETFLVCFVIFSLHSLIKSRDYQNCYRWFFTILSGFLMGWAIAFKQIAIFDIAALFVLAYYLTARKNIKNMFADFALLASGIIIAQAVSIVPLLLSGVTVWDYIYEAWLCLLQPGSGTMDIAIRIDHFFDAFLDLRLIIPYLCIIGFLKSSKRFADKMPLRSFWILWLILDFAGVNASGYYISHQLKQIIPAICIISGFFLDRFIYQVERKYSTYPLLSSNKYNTLFVIVILMFAYTRFEKRYWDTSPHRNSENAIYVGQTIRKLTSPEDFVLFWGGKHQVLTCSGRRSPSRHFHTLFIRRFGAEQEIRQDVKANPPTVIVIDRQEKVPEWLDEKIKKEYALNQTIFNYDMYILPEKIQSTFDKNSHKKLEMKK